ncbi:MAG: MBL fold metallo-hydrolase [Steroidobacteraceae bacterium]
MEIQFFGAAGEVTGSCHVVHVGGRQLLLDCGMVQGGRDAPERNREPFPFQAQAIDAVVLSHTHIDHCGRLPLLVKRGYRGPIYTNAACADLLPILLRDSAHLGIRDAERSNRYRKPDEPQATPLYDLDDVERTLGLVKRLPYDTVRALLPGVHVRVRDAGHIMGSSSIELWLAEGALRRKLVFSGDLGQYDSPILQDPYRFGSADVVLMESTYGHRRHRDRKATEVELGEILDAAWRDGGNIIIPAFAIGRSQEVLYLLGANRERWQVDRWRVFLDSPMAIEASRVYWKHVDRYDSEARHLRASFADMPPLPNLTLSRTGEESQRINRIRRGALIIAGSGMCNGGRVLHHLKHNIERPECHVVITGFQAPGTLGRAIVDRHDTVRIHRETLRVAAQVHTLGGLSAHGDQEDLLRWFGGFEPAPPVWLVHGEPEAAKGLAERFRARGVTASLAEPGLRVDLAGLPALADDHPTAQEGLH